MRIPVARTAAPVVNRSRGWAGTAAALLSLQLALALVWGLVMRLMTARAGG